MATAISFQSRKGRRKLPGEPSGMPRLAQILPLGCASPTHARSWGSYATKQQRMKLSLMPSHTCYRCPHLYVHALLWTKRSTTGFTFVTRDKQLRILTRKSPGLVHLVRVSPWQVVGRNRDLLDPLAMAQRPLFPTYKESDHNNIRITVGSGRSLPIDKIIY